MSDTEEHALRSADISARYAALLAAVEGVIKSAGHYQQDVSWIMVERAAFERLKGAIE